MSVYLVQFSEDPSLIKIGYSKTPRKRIKTLESYYGTALHIYTIKDEDSSTLERKLHKLFKHCRTSLPPRTEWYKRPRPGRTGFFRINSFKAKMNRFSKCLLINIDCLAGFIRHKNSQIIYSLYNY